MLFAIVGKSGTGKTRAISTLNPAETYIVNCTNKPLTFPGSMASYTVANKNYFVTDKYTEIIQRIRAVNAAPHIKNLILDDIGFVMAEEFFARASESGYNKFTDIGKHMQQIINVAKSCREDLNIVFNWHVDDVVSDGAIVESKIRTIGRLLDDKYNPAALFSILLFTSVSYARDGKPMYGFVTNRQKIGGKVIPAKTPEGMFDDLLIPNDLENVIETARRYFYGEQ